MAFDDNYDAENILDNLRNINKNNTLLDMLMEFENVFETQGMYAFKNWKLGEVVAGPDLSRYWMEVTLMYPYAKMPDPRAIERLYSLGCEIDFKKGIMKEPITPKKPDDLDENNKPKVRKLKVWFVNVKMPRRLVDEFRDEQIKIDDTNIDMEDLNQAYDQGLDDETRIENQGNV